jgi:SpoVK/Ycf46/Vps4 family AAA+-type ATPase
MTVEAQILVTDPDPETDSSLVLAQFQLPGWSWLQDAVSRLRGQHADIGVHMRWQALPDPHTPDGGAPSEVAGTTSDPSWPDGEMDAALACGLTVSPHRAGPRAPRQLEYAVTVPTARGAAAAAALPRWRRTTRTDSPESVYYHRTRDDVGAELSARECVRLLRAIDLRLPGRFVLLAVGPLPAPAAHKVADTLTDVCADVPDLTAPSAAAVSQARAAAGRVHDTSHLNPVARLADATGRLDELVGLDGVKEIVRGLRATAEIEVRRRAAGLPNSPMTRHMALVGNPGTGKTSIAGILADLYGALGILPRGQLVVADRAGLVSGFVGQTAARTSAVVRSALGGVLLVDEAYMLAPPESPQDFGHEAIATLVHLMEVHRDDLVVLLAGYPAEMTRLFDSNTGLRSRIARVLRFPDYSVDDLTEVFHRLAARDLYVLDPDVLPALRAHLIDEPPSIRAGNARAVRKIFDATRQRQAHRLAAEPTGPAEAAALSRIARADLPVAASGAIDDAELATAMVRLDALIGLVDVKLAVHDLVDLARVTRLRRAANQQTPSRGNHVVFVGNPGTGKTTVAELLGRIYAALGVLSSGHVHAVTRDDLVAGYVGQTSAKTRAAVEAAIGGVLFIDEAYTLAPQDDQRDVGPEAVAELLEAMETARDDLVVIAAGYPREMERFLGSNPGLRSRFSRTLVFADHGPTEAAQIVVELATRDGLVVGEATYHALVDNLTVAAAGPSWANGRTARSLFEDMIVGQARRLSGESDLAQLTGEVITPEEQARRLRELSPDDVPAPVGY